MPSRTGCIATDNNYDLLLKAYFILEHLMIIDCRATVEQQQKQNNSMQAVVVGCKATVNSSLSQK